MIERLAALPPAGGRVWYFPGATDCGAADIVARVFRRDGTSWLACLARPEPDSHDGIFALPCGERVFIAGGVADRDHPGGWTPLPLEGPLRAAWSPDRTAIAFFNRTSVTVFGQSGHLWSATLGSDATVSRVTDDAVECDVYDWVTGRPVTRRFDLRTGQPR